MQEGKVIPQKQEGKDIDQIIDSFFEYEGYWSDDFDFKNVVYG